MKWEGKKMMEKEGGKDWTKKWKRKTRGSDNYKINQI